MRQVDAVLYFSPREKRDLATRMLAQGLDTTQKDTISLSGRGKPLLAVFDPGTLQILALLPAPAPPAHKRQALAKQVAPSAKLMARPSADSR